jgi:hypothetical protein
LAIDSRAARSARPGAICHLSLVTRSADFTCTLGA